LRRLGPATTYLRPCQVCGRGTNQRCTDCNAPLCGWPDCGSHACDEREYDDPCQMEISLAEPLVNGQQRVIVMESEIAPWAADDDPEAIGSSSG
jgi:hypothetical protein